MINYIYGDTLPNGQPNPKRLMDQGLYRLAQSLANAAKIGKAQEFKDTLFKKPAERATPAAAPTPQQAPAPETATRKRPSDQLDASDLEFYKVVDNILSAPIEPKTPAASLATPAQAQRQDTGAGGAPPLHPDPPAASAAPANTPQPPQPEIPRRPPAPTRTTYLATKPKISAETVATQSTIIRKTLISGRKETDAREPMRAATPITPAQTPIPAPATPRPPQNITPASDRTRPLDPPSHEQQPARTQRTVVSDTPQPARPAASKPPEAPTQPPVPDPPTPPKKKRRKPTAAELELRRARMAAQIRNRNRGIDR